jgi:A/G-specific adenine glycosylase
LSEIMLQQTRVETVVPYFERFVTRYPRVADLAAAPLDDVLGMWSGLGYNRRARSMWSAAREVVARFGGELPSARAELESLPGIGPYTAGAIASIAHGREEALVDGNVSRVLARLFVIEDPLGAPAATRKLWAIAAELVRGPRPGDFNQALMELGATVCVPEQPRCHLCPIASACRARAAGVERELPKAAPKRSAPEVELTALVVARRRDVLLMKRPERGLYAGLWEPPMIATGDAARGRAALGLTSEGARRGRFEHVLTHRRLAVVVELHETRSAARPTLEPYVRAGWTRLDELEGGGPPLGLSRLARRVLEAAGVANFTLTAPRFD